MQADFIIDIGDKAQVPIISFSATSPSLSSIQSPYFIQATENDSFQVKAITAVIQAFGWREVVPIYVNNKYGEGAIPLLTDALQEIDTCVPYRSAILSSATDDQIVQELYKLMTMQTRVFIVHMLPSLGSRLFLKAKEVGMMNEGYVWIVTCGIGNLLSSMDPLVIDSMQGVLGVKTYVPKTKELQDFSIRWKRKFQQENPTMLNAELNIYGLWAYDAALALAMAVEKVGAALFGFQKMNIFENSTDLGTLGVSQSGPNIRQALSSTTFKGLVGDFHLVNGQLQSSAFEIVNVIGTGRRGIGFWTPKNGIMRKLNSNNTRMYSTSKANLGVIIWPGESQSVPKGWTIPTNGKTLRVGVPVTYGFYQFVKVTQVPNTSTTVVTGYCIDVFKAVMEALPYAVPYEFIPFEKPDGKSAGSYDDLIYQVYLKNYDAVVGDVTIIANRSLYVDFTLPYSEFGVSMVVPVKDMRKKAWVFLKPLTWDLWVTSACFFIFIGFVIWVLEHRINEDFRGPPSQQVGMIFWFSFSTMVFAHREKVVNNLARFVVLIWFFVGLILTQSYSASLTSMLTVQQLQPTFTDINELINRGEYVGYHAGSFIKGLLMKQMNFDESKLRAYQSPEDCDAAFSKGSANGGIAAAFEEVVYTKFFFAKYCSKYSMVGPKYKTDGFGFAFSRGSPLVPDVSRAILQVSESKKMVEIEKYWIGQSSCLNLNTSISSDSLGLDSFWGLFLIAGVASSSALIIFLATFLHDHRHVLMCSDPETSLWRKIVEMLRHFDQKDLSSQAFGTSKLQDRNAIDGMDHSGAINASPKSNDLSSTSSFSNHTDNNFVCSGEQGIPSVEFGDLGPNTHVHREIVSAI